MMVAMRSLSVLAAAVLLAGCAGRSPGPSLPPPGPLPRGTLVVSTTAGSARLAVEVARTEAARRYGLMNRHTLAPDAGMAFLFDQPVREGFWMRDTFIPLSIAFWGPDDRIAAILEMTPCGTGPCPISTSPSPYVGAAEANAGWFAAHGVRVGDRVLLIQTS
jgi:uncharacterized membrane protein (UPF0127 family)